LIFRDFTLSGFLNLFKFIKSQVVNKSLPTMFYNKTKQQ